MKTALIYIFDGDELVDVTLDESTAAAAAPTQIEREIVRIVREWKQLKENAVCFGKDVMFHRCTNGSIRHYHTGLCSTCLGKGEDFNAFERLRELRKCLTNCVLLRTADIISFEDGRYCTGTQTIVKERLITIRREVERVLRGSGQETKGQSSPEPEDGVHLSKTELCQRIKELEEVIEDAATACIDRSEHE